jgi:selenocysteine-specific elongation factor
MLSLKPLDPPSRKELSADSAGQQALRFLLQTGEAIEISPEVVLLGDGYTRATQMIHKYLAKHGSATVSELRQALGTSRRIVVPLLEKLDREGVTRREGDKRVLKKW